MIFKPRCDLPGKETLSHPGISQQTTEEYTMKKFIMSVIALVAVSFGGVAHAENAPFMWKHFGGAPYAKSPGQAMATRAEAFNCMGLPQNVVNALVAATASGGHRVRLVNGDHLDKMLSRSLKGACEVHQNVQVAFAAPVHNMEYAAPATQWDAVTVDGVQYVVTLPDICGNWSVTITAAPPPPPAPIVAPVPVADCVPLAIPLVGVNVEDTNFVEVEYQVSGPEVLTPSETCNMAGVVACDECFENLDAGASERGVVVSAPRITRLRRFNLVDHDRTWTVKFPLNVKNHFHVAVCYYVVTKDGVKHKFFSQNLISAPENKLHWVVPLFKSYEAGQS
jgi:hypothetical protein